MRFIGEETHIVMTKSAYKSLVRKPEGKKLLDRRRCRWENSVKMHATEIRVACENLYSINFYIHGSVHCHSILTI